MGETLLQFEHRDLHISNVMVNATRDKVYSYDIADHLDNDNSHSPIKTKQVTVATRGIKLTIIDFTLSRLLVDGEVSTT